MIPTGVPIPPEVVASSLTPGALLGPFGACLLLAVVAGFVFLVAALVGAPRAPRPVARVVPPERASWPRAAERRRPAA